MALHMLSRSCSVFLVLTNWHLSQVTHQVWVQPESENWFTPVDWSNFKMAAITARLQLLDCEPVTDIWEALAYHTYICKHCCYWMDQIREHDENKRAQQLYSGDVKLKLNPI